MQNMAQYIKHYILYIYKSIKQEVTIMGNYGITGWSGGGRRPITNNLRAGQFRQMGVPRNVSSNIFINNNFGCMGGNYNASYFDGCCGNQNDGLSKFEKWMLGLGVGGTLLSGILGLFGKGKQEGAGNTQEVKPETPAPEPAQPAQPNTTTTPIVEAPPEEEPSLPRLFNELGMKGFKTEADVLKGFKAATGTDAYKIDSSSGGITINQVEDKGNGTKQTGSITINAEQLKNLKDGTWTDLGTFHGKKASATNLDGYLKIKVGAQTYIVGKTQDNKYQGNQFNNNNAEGYQEYNWRFHK